MSASEDVKREPGRETEEEKGRQSHGNFPDRQHPVPLFLRGRSDGRHGDGQDEKDETGE